jgi:hypothetical protein
MAQPHLHRAALRALALIDAPDGVWVERAVFDAQLRQDEWVARNPHRLARLEFSLAVMATDGLLELSEGRIRLLAAGRLPAS